MDYIILDETDQSDVTFCSSKKEAESEIEPYDMEITKVYNSNAELLKLKKVFIKEQRFIFKFIPYVAEFYAVKIHANEKHEVKIHKDYLRKRISEHFIQRGFEAKVIKTKTLEELVGIGLKEMKR